MTHQWKSWLAAAAVLLTVGAGCVGTVTQDANVEVGGEQADDGRMPIEAEATFEASADAAVDAALGEADMDAKAEQEESSDANEVGNDSSELNAYGQSYVESELR